MGRPKSTATKHERLNLTIAPELKSRLTQAERDGIGLKWSLIASKALEAALDEVEVRQQSPEFADAIIRLRSYEQYGQPEPDRAAGWAAGRSWAMRKASPDLLAAVDRMEVSGELQKMLGDSSHYHDSLAERIWRKLWMPLIPPPGESPLTFWKDHVPDHLKPNGICQIDMLTADFIGGFAAGALEVWRKIRHLL
jgi:hypothetical protein